MDLTDLTHDERLALVVLVERVVGSDATVSEAEQAHIAVVAAAFGDDAYRALAIEGDERFADEAELKTFLETLTRPDARELIYGSVLDAAVPDLIDRHESSLLGWLATTWSITIMFDEP